MPNRSYIDSYYESGQSSESPAQLASQRISRNAESLNRLNGLVNGNQAGGRLSRKQQRRSRNRSRNNKRQQQRGGGRTFDVPLPTDPWTMPGPTYNNAWYTGAPCEGVHCGYPITPFVSEYINQALTFGNNPPPGATTQYTVIDRPGNSLGENLPGVSLYEGTELNPGPFNIRCVSAQSGGSRRRSNSRKQQRRSRSRRQNKKQQQRRGRN